MRHTITICCLLGLSLVSYTQDLRASYTAEIIKDSISTTTYDEVNPIYSAQTKTLYFSRANHPKNYYKTNKSQDTWFSTLNEDSTWTLPAPLPKEVNGSRYNNVLSVLEDGNTLLVSGYYTKNLRWYDRGLSIIQRGVGNTWNQPEQLTVKKIKKINEGKIMQAHMVEDKSKIYFSSDSRYLGTKNKLWVSHLKKSGKYKKPKKLKIENDVRGKKITPSVSVNGDTLFFSAKENKKLNFYKSIRDAEDEKYKKWLIPELISSQELNSKADEMFMSLTKDDQIAFFSSNRNGSWDIFKIRRFEKRPYIDLKGVIVNQYKNQPISSQYNPELQFKMVEKSGDTTIYSPDSLHIDTLMSSFRLRLPFDQSIIIEGNAKNFTNTPSEYNSLGAYEYDTDSINVYLSPLTYADIKGKIIDSTTNVALSKFELGQNPSIILAGSAYPNARIDSNANYDSVRLSLGNSYSISALVEGYTSAVSIIDLSNNEMYVDTTVNIYVGKTPDPTAHILTSILSAKDSSVVNEQIEVWIDGDKIKTNFENDKLTLKIPLNQNSLIHVHAHGYIDYNDTITYRGENRIDTSMVILLKPIEAGQNFVMDNVYFETAKATLKETSFPALDKLVNFLLEYPNMVIQIEGHTDNVGSAKNNLKLSAKRAASVSTYLVEQGIPIENIKSKGEGFNKPLFPNDTAENRAKNRRVEFTILKK